MGFQDQVAGFDGQAGFARDIRPAWPHSPAMRRILPGLLLVVLVCVGFYLARGAGWDSLARNQALLQDWARTHPLVSAEIYLFVYTSVAALSLPQATILTVAGGMLFGPVLGCALTVAGATLGATILVAIVRSALGQALTSHFKRIPEAVRDRLATDGFSYLLALRLVPLFPFWIVNLAAAVAGIRLAAFIPATVIGIAPASFILTSIGADASMLLAEGKTPDLSMLLSPRTLLPLAGLAVLSLLPALFRRRPGFHV
jgi:uncharacterized membrane protein YdjX (TVP38/TMEM64 family)